jgi:hypothetical protein
MFFRSSCPGVGQISILIPSYLRQIKPTIPTIFLTTNTFSSVLSSLKKNEKIPNACVITSRPRPLIACQTPGSIGLVDVKKPLLDLRSRQFAFYELELLTSDDHHFSLHPHLAFIIAPLDSDPAEGLVRFTVPYRSTKFPSKSSRKRRNTFGRALSLTDRKHYKMGRSNAKT